jgi:2-polyprenyl-6-methoxyphenol hydroxylase-like FAD-dependent oxidoreductase
MLMNCVEGDGLRNLVDKTVNHGFYRNQEGHTIFDFRGLADGLERRYIKLFLLENVRRSLAYIPRHGYPVIFIERQMLLKALYENLQSKEKVLLQKRFMQMEQKEDGVRVTTQDGYSYEGDIIIGADGMHSSVRKSMHNLGNSLSPGYFDRDEYSSK